MYKNIIKYFLSNYDIDSESKKNGLIISCQQNSNLKIVKLLFQKIENIKFDYIDQNLHILDNQNENITKYLIEQIKIKVFKNTLSFLLISLFC